MRYRFDNVRMQIDRMRPRLEAAKTWAARLAGRFRSLPRAKKVVLGVAIGGVLAAPAAQWEGAEQSEVTVRQSVQEPVVVPKEDAPPESPDEKLIRIATRIKAADEEAIAAINRRMQALSSYIDQRKRNGRTFAEDILGAWGKAKATWAVGEGIVGAIGGALGGDTQGPNSFQLYVRESFARHFFDAKGLQKEIDQMFSDCIGDIAAIESRLLVDLKTDINIESFAHPAMRSNSLAWPISLAIDDLVDVAAKNYVASLAKGAISMVVGDAIERKVVDRDVPGIVRAGAGLYISSKVDQAIDAAASRAGYDPESEIAAKAAGYLESIKVYIFKGGYGVAANFGSLLDNHLAHPDPKARAACKEAVDAALNSSKVGALDRINTYRLLRIIYRDQALYLAIFGEPLPHAAQIDGFVPGESADIIEFARKSLDLYRSNP